MRTLLRVFAVLALLGTFCFADNLTGTVTNGTNNKPAGGDDVVLLKLGEGMAEAGRVKTNAQGKFSLPLDDANAPHLVRVIHQGVTYHRMAPPGTTSVEIQVFDAAKKVEGIGITADVMRFQAQGDQLQGTRLFAVDNNSNPPRTLMTDKGFEFYLPPGAVVDGGEATTAGGNPLNLAPVPQDEKDRYAFIFPLRPGETTFQLSYHMSYSGSLNIDPKLLYGTQHFVVMLPKGMQFAGATGSAYKSMKSPKEPDTEVQVASNTSVGDPLGFKISGTGMMSSGGQDQQAEGGGPEGRDTRPGGGLGPPIDAPRPMQKYTWWILGVFGVALIGGAVFTALRSPAATTAPAVAAVAAAPKPSSGSALLDALKDEIFQLEMEHKAGSITHDEYTKAKSALDQTLERALKRKA